MTAAEALNEPGAVAVIPTDTVYGLVARASDEAAVSRLYQLKKRSGKPGTLIAADIDQLVQLGIKRRYLTAVSQFWPGPVSVVIPLDDNKLDYLAVGARSLAVRLPKDARLGKLIKVTGPLLTSSANLKDQPPADTIEQAQAIFGSSVNYYQDGGDLSGRTPSTVVRIIDDEIEVIRQGAGQIK